jgi:MerR family copper efflux transcriptional regulator
MLIGELAAASGLSREALRFYEQQGLIRARRLDNGYRDYPAEAVALVQYIRTAQQLGLYAGGDRRPAARHLGRAPSPALHLAQVLADEAAGDRHPHRRAAGTAPDAGRARGGGLPATAPGKYIKMASSAYPSSASSYQLNSNQRALAFEPSPRYSQGTSSRRSPSRRRDRSRAQRTGPVAWKMRPLRCERACTRPARSQRLRA